MPIDAAALTCPCTLKLMGFLFVSVVVPQMLADVCCYPLHVLLFFLFSGCCKIVAFSTGLQDREITKGNHKRYSSFYLFFFFFKHIKNGMSKLFFFCFTVHYLTELP
uniref:Uncharacterized protein n=1 Tax=Rhipicephalus zambeziensis TaxID=60191 RepID=A0A224Y721_9ACAR